jgi:plastocyanin
MVAFNSARFSLTLRWMLAVAALAVPQVVQAQWRATVGAQSSDQGHQALAFLPNEIWIHPGDDITWKFNADEIHTLTFLKSGQTRLPFQVGCPGFSPSGSMFDGSTCVTTPFMVKGQTFKVTFPKAGNFKLVCLVHQDMTGTIHVLPFSQPLPHDQDFYDDQAVRERIALLSDRDNAGEQEGDREGDDDWHSESAHGNHVAVGVGEVTANGGGSQTLSVMRFRNATIVIHAGETVEWTNTDPVTPHTITFGIEPANPMPPSANVTVDADGARHAVISTPSDSAHSGFIVAAPQERIGLPLSPLSFTRFRVTFKNAGVFHYICALHDVLGMKGKVIVLP